MTLTNSPQLDAPLRSYERVLAARIKENVSTGSKDYQTVRDCLTLAAYIMADMSAGAPRDIADSLEVAIDMIEDEGSAYSGSVLHWVALAEREQEELDVERAREEERHNPARGNIGL